MKSLTLLFHCGQTHVSDFKCYGRHTFFSTFLTAMINISLQHSVFMTPCLNPSVFTRVMLLHPVCVAPTDMETTEGLKRTHEVEYSQEVLQLWGTFFPLDVL